MAYWRSFVADALGLPLTNLFYSSSATGFIVGTNTSSSAASAPCMPALALGTFTFGFFGLSIGTSNAVAAEASQAGLGREFYRGSGYRYC